MTLLGQCKSLAASLGRGGVPEGYRHVRKMCTVRWYRWRGTVLNNRRGWRSDHPLLVIESDDWGTERTRSALDGQALREAGLGLADQSGLLDGLETRDDVAALCEVLSAHKDSLGRPAVMTVNFVLANADFDSVAKSDYGQMAVKSIVDGWNHESDAERLWQAYRGGVDAGLLVPQFHGYLHFSPDSWLAQLRGGDVATKLAFDRRMIGPMSEASGLRTMGVSSLYDREEEAIRRHVSEGMRLFRAAFGRGSVTTIAPRYVWRSPETELIMAEHGIRAMQGKQWQYLPDGRCRARYIGQRGAGGMLYLVRNCDLEPIAGGTTVEGCMRQVTEAFSRGLPAVLCSHRINYTSRVSPGVRDEGLAVLNEVLGQVVAKYPNVEFVGSDALAERILARGR
jgi:hypothetical protein